MINKQRKKHDYKNNLDLRNVIRFLDYKLKTNENEKLKKALIKNQNIKREIERQRSFSRRNVKRNPVSIDPIEEFSSFIDNNDVLKINLYHADIKSKLSTEQADFFELMQFGYTLSEISDILSVSYMTLRRNLKKIKSIVDFIVNYN